jgi:hypothetical protein
MATITWKINQLDRLTSDGFVTTAHWTCLGVDASFLVATLAAAIQELKAEFDAYKATHP